VVDGYKGGTYDGSQHTRTITVTGVGSDGTLFTDSLTGKNAGVYSQGWSFSSNPNYKPISGTLDFNIAKADAKVEVTGPTGGTSDGHEHPQIITVTGVGGDGQLFTVSLTGQNAGDYSKAWSFSNDNYNPVGGTLAFNIAKADAKFVVSGYEGGTYDGAEHTR